ncbi:hypothetical protein [Xanthomonas sp. NCPPB 2632]|uniref:hypothetical protein n=1 Tax=Xanthomonas sp. NCPPB 2632 TaxID=3240912 RepID=UPI0035160C91
MTNDESLPGKARPSSLRAVHKLARPDPLYDLRLQRELEIANACTRIELGAAGGCVTDEPRRKPCLPEVLLADEVLDVAAKEAEMLRLKELGMAGIVSMTAGCALVDEQGSGYSATSWAHYSRKVERRHIAPKIKNDKLIMPFVVHNFSSFCFDTIKCRVLYKNRYARNEGGPSGPLTDAIRENLSAGWITLDKPSVAHVSWVSKNGDNHDAVIDLDEIFQDRLVRYSSKLNINDVDLEAYTSSPDIILVVEDRSIQVYMKAMIYLYEPRDPNNRFSDFRDDLVLVHTKNF